MTRPRWEYMRIGYTYETDNVGRADQTWKHTYGVYRPDRPDHELPGDTNFLELLNELGDEGWELVSENVRETTLIAQMLGWQTVGAPVRLVWTFKRPAG